MKIRIKKQLNENNNVEQVFSLENMNSTEGWAKQLRFIFAIYNKFKKFGEDDSKFAKEGDRKAYKIHLRFQEKYLDPADKQEDEAFDYLFDNLDKVESGEMSVDDLRETSYKKMREAMVNYMNIYIAYAKNIQNEKILLNRDLYKEDLKYLQELLEMTRETLKSFQELDKNFAKQKKTNRSI